MCFPEVSESPEDKLARQQVKNAEQEEMRDKKKKLLAEEELRLAGRGTRSLITGSASGYGSNYGNDTV